MRKVKLLATCFVAATLALGCGASAPAKSPMVSNAERTRAALQGSDAQTVASLAFAEADQSLHAAKEAEKAGDSGGAELHAERAVAAYQHAVALARLAHASEEERQAKEALARATDQATRYGIARKAAEREADDLDKQLKIAREAVTPSSSGPTDPNRERARLIAAQSLATQARLLCSAARLVSAESPGLAEAEAAATELEKKLEASPKPAPIDLAGRVRAACLGALTKARRASASQADPTDALLGEISRSSDPKAKSTTDLAPSRDERGVVVALRSLFQADKLSSEGEAALADLGRVAAAHPNFAVQIVIHDATPPGAADIALDKRRGEAIKKALVEAGANATKTTVEQAGARAPVVDPTDAKRRPRNARVEIVFVAGS